METIEYLKQKINVPTSWDEIRLGDYERFYGKTAQTHRERVQMLAGICQIDAELLFSWPAEIFGRVQELAGFVFDDNALKTIEPTTIVETGGVKYYVNISDKLTLGEFIDADEVQKEGEGVLSGVLAIVCRPAGESYDADKTDERAEMFKAVPVGRVFGVLAFFLDVNRILEQRTAAYSSLRELCDRLPTSTAFLASLGAGTKLSRIYLIIKYCVLIRSLRSQLRKLSHFYNTGATRTSQRMHSAN